MSYHLSEWRRHNCRIYLNLPESADNADIINAAQAASQNVNLCLLLSQPCNLDDPKFKTTPVTFNFDRSGPHL